MALEGTMLVIVLSSSIGGSLLLLAFAIIIYIARQRFKRRRYRIDELHNDRLASLGGFSEINDFSVRPTKRQSLSMKPPNINFITRPFSAKSRKSCLLIHETPPRKLYKRDRSVAMATSNKSRTPETGSRYNQSVDQIKIEKNRRHSSNQRSFTAIPRPPSLLPTNRRSLSIGACVGGNCIGLYRCQHHLGITRIPKADLKRSISDNYVGEPPKYGLPPPPGSMVRCPRVQDILAASQNIDRGSINSVSSSILHPCVYQSETKVKRHEEDADYSLIHDENTTQDHIAGRAKTSEAIKSNETVLLHEPKPSNLIAVRPKLQTQKSYSASVEDSGTLTTRASVVIAGALTREKSSELSMSLLTQKLTPAQLKTTTMVQQNGQGDEFGSPTNQASKTRRAASFKTRISKNQSSQKLSLIAVKDNYPEAPTGSKLQSVPSMIRYITEWQLESDYARSKGNIPGNRKGRLDFYIHHDSALSSVPKDSEVKADSDNRRSHVESLVDPNLYVKHEEIVQRAHSPPSSKTFTFEPNNDTYSSTSTTFLSQVPSPSSSTPSPKSQPRKMQSHPLQPPEFFLPSPQYETCPPAPLLMHAPLPQRNQPVYLPHDISRDMPSPQTPPSQIKTKSRSPVNVFLADLPSPPPHFQYPPRRSPLSRAKNSIRGPRPAPLRQRAARRSSPTRPMTSSSMRERMAGFRERGTSPLRSVARISSDEGSNDSQNKASVTADQSEKDHDGSNAVANSCNNISVGSCQSVKRSSYAPPPLQGMGLVEFVSEIRRGGSCCSSVDPSYHALGAGTAMIRTPDMMTRTSISSPIRNEWQRDITVATIPLHDNHRHGDTDTGGRDMGEAQYTKDDTRATPLSPISGNRSATRHRTERHSTFLNPYVDSNQELDGKELQLQLRPPPEPLSTIPHEESYAWETVQTSRSPPSSPSPIRAAHYNWTPLSGTGETPGLGISMGDISPPSPSPTPTRHVNAPRRTQAKVSNAARENWVEGGHGLRLHSPSVSPLHAQALPLSSSEISPKDSSPDYPRADPGNGAWTTHVISLSGGGKKPQTVRRTPQKPQRTAGAPQTNFATPAPFVSPDTIEVRNTADFFTSGLGAGLKTVDRGNGSEISFWHDSDALRDERMGRRSGKRVSDWWEEDEAMCSSAERGLRVAPLSIRGKATKEKEENGRAQVGVGKVESDDVFSDLLQTKKLHGVREKEKVLGAIGQERERGNEERRGRQVARTKSNVREDKVEMGPSPGTILREECF